MSRLRDAVDGSRKKLEPFRRQRHDFIKQFIGKHYSDNGAGDRVPVNLMELAVNIYTRQLAARAPRAMVTTVPRKLKATAALLELALNHLVVEIDLETSLRRWVQDALFSMGIIKVGLNRLPGQEIDGVAHDVGQPFADVVSLDDWFHDMAAPCFERAQFMGNYYRLPLEYVKESDVFDRKVTSRLTTPTEHESQDEFGNERVGKFSRGESQVIDEYHKTIRLLDVWLPIENKMVTFADQMRLTPIRVLDWGGPERGPYHILAFEDVPDQVMPLSPAAIWMDLHDLTNRLFRKLARQAERQKTVLGVQGANKADGERIVDANDGETIRIDNPRGAQEFRFGGADQAGLGFVIQVRNIFNSIAGNLDILGGLAAQSETATQDKLLSEGASKRVADMEDRTLRATKKVMRDLSWYLWTDPLIELPLTKEQPGSDMPVELVFTPDEIEGDFLDYNIGIQPFSMQHQTPAGKLNTLQQVFGSFVVPFLPLLQQQGITINFEGLLKMVAKLSNMQELDDVLTFSGLSIEERTSLEQRAPANTTRTNVRRNVAQSTPQGQEQVLAQLLAGGNPQESQLNSLARNVG